MPLTSGTRLGAYEIVSPLGEGGMGMADDAHRHPVLGHDERSNEVPDQHDHRRRVGCRNHCCRALAVIERGQLVPRGAEHLECVQHAPRILCRRPYPQIKVLARAGHDAPPSRKRQQRETQRSRR